MEEPVVQEVGNRVPASAIASFDPVESLGREFMSRPGVGGSATYEFNVGMRGLHARYAGAELALATLKVPDLVGAAQTVLRRPPVAWVLVDTYVSLFLFSAWSSIECLVYAVNALGFSISPTEFCDIDSESGLRGISPRIIIGQKALPGFPRHFPSLTSCLVGRSSDVLMLQQQHNVSKHRRAVAAGGEVNDRMRQALARMVGDDLANQVALQRASWDNILLDPEPHRPLVEHDRTRAPLCLDDLASSYRSLMHAAGHALCDDLRRRLAATDPTQPDRADRAEK